MRLYTAFDLHANNSYGAIIGEQGQRVKRQRLANDPELIFQFLSPYKAEIVGVVVESTYNWYWLVDALMSEGYKVHLANTAGIQKYKGLKHSDDQDDAFWLAEMLRLNILPEGHIYPKEERPHLPFSLFSCPAYSLYFERNTGPPGLPCNHNVRHAMVSDPEEAGITLPISVISVLTSTSCTVSSFPTRQLRGSIPSSFRLTAYLLAVLRLKPDVTTRPPRTRYPVDGLPSGAGFPPAGLRDLARPHIGRCPPFFGTPTNYVLSMSLSNSISCRGWMGESSKPNFS